MRHRYWAVVVSAGMLSACSGQGSSTDPPSTDGSTGTPARETRGKHVVAGRAPVTTSGIPAVVILEPRHAGQLPEPIGMPIMDQASRTFVPSMLFVRTGHPAEFRNSDEEMHNINVKDATTREQTFNVAVPTNEKYIHTFGRSGAYDVSCDIHAGMSAQIVAASTPYVTVVDTAGHFAFHDVVPGMYAVTVYAGVQTIERTIEVAGARTEVDVTRP